MKKSKVLVQIVYIVVAFAIISSACGTQKVTSNVPTADEQRANDAVILQATMDAMVLQMTADAVNMQMTQVAMQATQVAFTQMGQSSPGDVKNGGPTVEPPPTIGQEEGSSLPISETAFTDDFSNNLGNFSTTDMIVIENGALYMGEFERCADFSSDQPVGCISVCQTCGDVREYEAEVEVVYVDGITDRLYGLALRFDDENGNHRIDREDYFLGWGFSLIDGTWYLYEHQRDRFAPWRLVTSGRAHLRASPRQPNYLRVVATQEGSRLDIYMNDTRMVRVVNTHPIPGEVYVEKMPQSGAIGFWVGERGIRVFYDNFAFTNRPNEDE